MNGKINFNKNDINKIICYTILILMTIIVFSPIIYAFLTSFMTNKEIMAGKIFPETTRSQTVFSEAERRSPGKGESQTAAS